MVNNSKRFLSLLLALVMVIALMPVGYAHAEGESTVAAARVMTTNGATGDLVSLEDCEYTLSGDENGSYSFTAKAGNNTVYVKPKATSDAKVPQSTDPFTALTLGTWNDNGFVRIFGDGGYMHFHYDDEKPHWNRCSNDTCGDGKHGMYIFAPSADATDSPIPGYKMVKSVEKGSKYLIAGKGVYQSVESWYVMRPSTSTDYYNHIAKVVSVNAIELEVGETHVITIEGDEIQNVADNDVVSATNIYKETPVYDVNMTAGVTDLDNFENGTYVIYSCRNDADWYGIKYVKGAMIANPVENGGKTGLEIVTELTEKAYWTISKIPEGQENAGKFTISYNGENVSINGKDNVNLQANAVVDIVNTDNTEFGGDTVAIKVAGEDSGNICLNQYNSFGDKSATQNAASCWGSDINAGGMQWHLYSATFVKTQKTNTITFEALKAGAAEITIGDAKYTFIVTNPCEHVWSDWTVTTEPTLNTVGQEEHTCTLCGESETRPVDVLDYEKGAVPVKYLIATDGSHDSADDDNSDGPATYAVDGYFNTQWHTDYNETSHVNHWIQFELTEDYEITGLRFKSRGADTNGNITKYKIVFGNTVEDLTLDKATVEGTGSNSNVWDEIKFDAQKVKYVRLYVTEAITTQSPKQFAAAVEMRLLGTKVEEPKVTLIGGEAVYDAEIGMRMYLDIPESMKNATIVLTKDGHNGLETKEFSVNEMEYIEDKGNCVSIGVASGELGKNITVKVMDGDDVLPMYSANGTEYTEWTTTVADCAKAIKDSEGTTKYTQAQKDAAAALLVYGGYAQKHFGVDAENPVYGATAPALENVVLDSYKTTQTTDEGVTFGLTFAGIQAYLDYSIYNRVYLTLAEGAAIDNYTFALTGPNGESTLDAKYDDENKLYYVDITNVAAAYLDEEYTITITGTEGKSVIKTSVLSWAKGAVKANKSETQVNLAKALYLYNQAANVLFGK